MAPAPAAPLWPQRGQAQRSLQQGREGSCAGGAAWVQRGHLAPRGGLASWKHRAATLPGCCHQQQATGQRGPWWMAGKPPGASALASGACWDASGSIVSVRAATRPCGAVTSPPCSSALLRVCMRCVARGLCRAFGWGVTAAWFWTSAPGESQDGMRCPEPWLCYLGKDEASAASAWLGAACRVAPGPEAALEAVGAEQPRARSSSLGAWVPAHSMGVIFPPPCAGKVSRASAALTCPCGL